ncbi:MAG: fibronectin type III domain-containing protein [Candidatus Sumerlaeaceae bacterium]|nr:fibronectin type III domain-containing protein [Candidatus Sumerlaeaceae bacterium]
MKRLALGSMILAMVSVGVALTNGDFNSGGAGWTTYTAGSGSVSFSGTTADINAIAASLAGLEQAESGFTTTGQEYELTTVINNIGNIETGWRNVSDVTFASSTYAGGQTGTRTVKCDNPTYNIVFAEKVGVVGGIGIQVESMQTAVITAPPTAGTALTATRAGNTSANVTWTTGTDNISAQSEIVYRVFWDTNSANVISSGVRQSFTGQTAGLVTGLPASAQVFFSVRAEDRVGNRETNITQVSIPSNASVADWVYY